jgi:hypothetical protein
MHGRSGTELRATPLPRALLNYPHAEAAYAILRAFVFGNIVQQHRPATSLHHLSKCDGPAAGIDSS